MAKGKKRLRTAEKKAAALDKRLKLYMLVSGKMNEDGLVPSYRIHLDDLQDTNVEGIFSTPALALRYMLDQGWDDDTVLACWEYPLDSAEGGEKVFVYAMQEKSTFSLQELTADKDDES